jgi:hypothetical protein
LALPERCGVKFARKIAETDNHAADIEQDQQWPISLWMYGSGLT